MIRLVEGCENNFRTDELCDDKLRENEVSSTKESAQARTHENPALLPGTSSSCRRNEMTDFGSNFPTCRSKIMSEGSYPTSGDHRRYRKNLRIARKMPRMPRSSMYVIFIMILSLLSTVGLVLAIFTSLKVAKLENSSLHAASCDKGENEQTIDCEHYIQEMEKKMKKSLTDAMRDLQEAKEILEILKNSSTKFKENVPAASANTLPHFAYNLSLCSYKTKTNTSRDPQVSVSETKDVKLLGVNCETNDANDASLSSNIEADGTRSYKCSCKGTFKCSCEGAYRIDSPYLDCYIHYWECPI